MKEIFKLNQSYPVYDEDNNPTDMVAVVTGERDVECPFTCNEPFQHQYELTIQIPNKKPITQFVIDSGLFIYKAKRYHINPYILLFSLS